jgi:hypothetical protein
MADLPEYPDGGHGVGDDREPRPATPRRIYVLWIAAIGLVVLMLVLHVAGVFGPGGH